MHCKYIALVVIGIKTLFSAAILQQIYVFLARTSHFCANSYSLGEILIDAC